jgi:protein associated with RNAse G/E
METITVIKLDSKGNETWRYNGRVLKVDQSCIVLEAFFDRQDMLFHGMPMQLGDRFVETYYTDRWYNIFEIHAHQDDHIRGWYINIAFPAVFEDGCLSYKDLALDVLVFPDGRQVLVDEDEFNALNLSRDIKKNALDALAEIQMNFKSRDLFDGKETR